MFYQSNLISPEQYKEAFGHECKYADRSTQGAIGGRFTYSFTPTDVITIVKITCACGYELDCSDYDNF